MCTHTCTYLYIYICMYIYIYIFRSLTHSLHSLKDLSVPKMACLKTSTRATFTGYAATPTQSGKRQQRSFALRTQNLTQTS